MYSCTAASQDIPHFHWHIHCHTLSYCTWAELISFADEGADIGQRMDQPDFENRRTLIEVTFEVLDTVSGNPVDLYRPYLRYTESAS